MFITGETAGEKPHTVCVNATHVVYVEARKGGTRVHLIDGTRLELALPIDAVAKAVDAPAAKKKK